MKCCCISSITNFAKVRYSAYTFVMNVSLTKELEILVQQKVETGRYSSASEVIRHALRVLEEQDRLREAQIMEVRGKIAEGLADMKAGRVVDGPQSFERARARVEKLKKSRKTK